MTDGLSPAPPDRGARRLLDVLARASGAGALLVGGAVVAWRLGWLDGAGRSGGLVRAAVRTGAAGLALGPMLLLFAGALACRAPLPPRGAGPPRRWPGIRRPTLLAQTVTPPLAVIAGACGLSLLPRAGAPSPADAAVVAGVMLALAFPMLVAERSLASTRAATLPQAAALRALALQGVLALPIGSAVTLAVGLGQDWALWVAAVADGVVVLVAAELAARALGQWFLPPDRRRAPVSSLLASMLAGSLGREGAAAPLRAQLGLDFSRSWGLAFLRRAVPPALALTALLCWMLSGLVALPTDRRAIAERFGAPVAVLGPGLHAVLPWPLGRARVLEFGVVHELAVGGAARAGVGADALTAEAAPPASADRLWNQAHPGEVTYLIASETDGRQGFQTVSVDLRVLWRVGLGEGDALRAAYGATDPDALVRAAVGRQLARFFASRALDALLDARREAMAETLRTAVAADLAPLASGVEVLAVVVEAVHPPAGAAAAYHAVQAARITAATSVASERGRARGTSNQARQEAQRLTSGAAASAAETVASARTDAVRADADRAAASLGGRAFMLERYLEVLGTALARTPLTLVDDRLDAATAPVLDLRPLARTTAPIPGDED